MNSNLNSSTQFSNDADVYAYRGEAARLRSAELRKLVAAFAAWFSTSKSRATAVASNAGRQMDCEAC